MEGGWVCCYVTFEFLTLFQGCALVLLALDTGRSVKGCGHLLMKEYCHQGWDERDLRETSEF